MREVLATAMLEALGAPTSRSFSLIETGEALERGDEPSPTRGAVLTRLSHSHIRFGSFQRLAALARTDLMAILVAHCLECYAPHFASAGDPGAALLACAVTGSARLTARWMTAGFVHGVLNTDNMNINGESFDYGPYRFLPRNDPNFTAAYFDNTGLYSFGRQPEAVFWNLRQLAGALNLITPEAPLVEALNGLSPEDDIDLANLAFRAIGEGGELLRWEPFFFDWFGGDASEERAMRGPRAALYGGDAFKTFRARLSAHKTADLEALGNPWFHTPEPEELLYDQIEAIWARIADADDWSAFNAKLAAIETARAAWNFTRAPDEPSV